MFKNPYKILGVPEHATLEQVDQAFRRLAYRSHPDRNPGDAAAHAEMVELNAARDTLNSPSARAELDTRLRRERAAAAKGAPGETPETKAPTGSGARPARPVWAPPGSAARARPMTWSRLAAELATTRPSSEAPWWKVGGSLLDLLWNS